MKKHLLLLALLAFTFNVNADNQYLDWDFTAAEGEDITVERVIALQFAKGEWDENTTNMWDYLLNGQNMRVYRHIVDDIDQPQDYYIYTAVGHKYYDDLLHIYYIDYSINRQYESDLTVGELIDRIIQLNTSEYRLLSAVSNDGQTETYSNVKYTQQGWTVGEDDNGEYLNLGSTVSSPALDDFGNNASSVAQVLTDDSLRKSLLQYASIPLNDVRITITNSAGQVTSQHDYTSYLVSIQSLLGQLNSNLTDLKNSLGFSGSASDNLAHFLGQWRTTDGLNQGAILNAITNLADYTELLKFYIYNGSHSITNNDFIYNLEMLYTYPEAFSWNFGLTDVLDYEEYNKLYGKWYGGMNYIYQLLNRILIEENPAISTFQLTQDILKYNTDLVLAYNDMERKDFALSWLNLATNDLNSFTYWLNQQTFTQNGTNDISSAEKKWDAITNQYAQISLVGANASNTAQNWDYFKRLEMLLAALVYKPDKMEGDMPQDKTAIQSTEASDKQSEVNQSLDSLASSLSTDSLETSGQSLVSLFTRFQSTLTQSFQPRYIVLFETGGEGQPTRSGSSNDDLDIEIALDFEDERFDGVLDIVRTIFGMVWATIGLFACWAVMKKCYFIGYKIAVFCFAFFRRILGL